MRNSANNISDRVVKNLNKLAYKGQINRFRETFYDLSYHHKQCYLHTTIVKCHAKVMYCILSSIKRDEALSVLYDLFQEKKGFAFNTLDVIAHQSIFLFRTLFSQLNSQQKEDYKIYLEIKSTVSAKHILERFYSNDKRKPKAENSNAKNFNTDHRLLRQRKKPTQNRLLPLNNSANFLPNSAEETTDQHEIEPPTVNLSVTPEEYQDILSESQSLDELIYWTTGEQLSNSLQLSTLEKFNELEEVIIEPAVKRQRVL
ncbi:hypothetical protein [Wolbachia endosymbiont of Ctenocephalides felis wCfeJ]|uniref:hypothetical protein n=1 Tax=Wolbachia endosymbiont of Ctenocephalides felis wCfeJ TaxID=2732594 RepID=UPI00144515C8|nr:hypothetical protein [Wolbachia endosymbiont of Ctenocephalides felis wCfeJ]WCR58003.1 MAG: hypothetical protein PG980_000475 [Wolbachia endosymbiont of Ctenocephalides felis wCfeJ]